jgi:hypothetical protein
MPGTQMPPSGMPLLELELELAVLVEAPPVPVPPVPPLPVAPPVLLELVVTLAPPVPEPPWPALDALDVPPPAPELVVAPTCCVPDPAAHAATIAPAHSAPQTNATGPRAPSSKRSFIL